MEAATGGEAANKLLKEIVEDEKKEEGSSDYGCICEIDLQHRVKIMKIMSQLLYPPKATTGPQPPAATTSSESEETKEESKKEESSGAKGAA